MRKAQAKLRAVNSEELTDNNFSGRRLTHLREAHPPAEDARLCEAHPFAQKRTHSPKAPIRAEGSPACLNLTFKAFLFIMFSNRIRPLDGSKSENRA